MWLPVDGLWFWWLTKKMVLKDDLFDEVLNPFWIADVIVVSGDQAFNRRDFT